MLLEHRCSGSLPSNTPNSGALLSAAAPPLVDEGALSAPVCSAALLLLHFSRPTKKCTLARPWVLCEPWKLKVPQHERTIGLLHPCRPVSHHGNVVLLWRCLTGWCTLKHWKHFRIRPLILSANLSSCCCYSDTFHTIMNRNLILLPFSFN